MSMNPKINLRRFLVTASLLIYGGTCFSSLSYKISVDVLGLPFFIWEHAIIIATLILFYLGPLRKINLFLMAIFIFGFAGWILLILQTKTFFLRDIYSAARPWLVIFFFAIVSGKVAEIEDKNFILLISGAVGGELLSYFLAWQQNNTGEFIFYVSYMLLFLGVTMSVWRTGLSLFNFIYLSFLFLLAFVSGFRVNILVFVITVLAIVFSPIKLQSLNISMRKKIYYICLFIIAIAILIKLFAEAIDPLLYFRVVERLIGALSNNVDYSQDGDKFYMIKNLFSLQELSLLPGGFDMISKDRVGLYMDNPIIHVLNVFGVFIGSLLIFLLMLGSALLAFRLFLGKVRVGNYLDFAAVIFCCIFPLLFVLNGRFLYITYDSAIFGLFLGRAFHCLRAR